MVEQLMQHLMQSGAGKQMLTQLKGVGLDEQQTNSALGATAEGLVNQLSAQGGVGAIMQGLGGLLGGNQTGASLNLESLLPPVTQFVAQKTGIAPSLAQAAVTAVLPKMLELIEKGDGKGALGSIVGNFLK